jgi:hypothetical protein
MASDSLCPFLYLTLSLAYVGTCTYKRLVGMYVCIYSFAMQYFSHYASSHRFTTTSTSKEIQFYMENWDRLKSAKQPAFFGGESDAHALDMITSLTSQRSLLSVSDAFIPEFPK